MILRYGNRSDTVRELQRLLISHGYTLPITGLFHNTTLSSVKAFQRRNGLVVDGIVGKATWEALRGTTAVYTTIPFPTANRSLIAARDTLRAMQSLVDLDIKNMLVIIGMESNYDYAVKARTSSATGWFQFINATWDEMVRNHGGKYGIVNDASRSARLDPRANALMGVEFTSNNIRYLRNKVGREPVLVEIYIAHFLGAGTAAKYMQADPNTIGAVMLPKPAAANPSVFYKDKARTQSRTLKEITEYFQNRLQTTINNVEKVLS